MQAQCLASDDDHKPYTQIPPMDIYTSVEAWKSFQPALSQQSFKFKIVLKRYIIQIDTDSDTIPSRDSQKAMLKDIKCILFLKQSFSDGNSFYFKMYSNASNSLFKQVSTHCI